MLCPQILSIQNMVKYKQTKSIGNEMYELIEELYPICSSITGEGARKTLQVIKNILPIKINEVPTGTKVFDWVIPKEWNIRDAYIKGPDGEKIVDFKKSNLHVVSYSVPINKKMKLTELEPHLHSFSEQPKLIPYLTTYYKEDWGFCVSHEQLSRLRDTTYEIVIDSTLTRGYLSYGELYIKGKLKEEYLFTCYICHPSMCNDNLSGIALITFLARKVLENKNPKYSYRFLFIPETIGSIAWLSLNEQKTKNIIGGLVATCLGDAGKSTYKKTRDGNALIDKVVEKILSESGQQYEIMDFFPNSGSDERQFASPAFNLPIGSLMRTAYRCFPYYHTSGDDLNFVKPEFLADSFEKYSKIIFIIENNKTYLNLYPKGEPQLGRRGIYNTIGGKQKADVNIEALLWVLNLSDSKNSLLDISIRSKTDFVKIKNAADILFDKKIIKDISNKKAGK